MNIGFWSCIVLVLCFGILGILFGVFKEKSARFVSGFHELSKEEQDLYDKDWIARDMRNSCFLWMTVMLAGSVLPYVVTPYMAIGAYVLWLILFLKDVHMDTRKAFRKYLKQ